jgi:hypothetical protein
MIAIHARPYDDKSIVTTYLVENDGRSEKAFLKAWNAALDSAKKKDPEAWIIENVLKILERNGWRFLRVSSVDVEY